MKQEETYRVQALERALDIIDCFSFQQREFGNGTRASIVVTGRI